MAKKPPDNRPSPTSGTVVTIYAKLSDTEPFRKLLQSLGRLHGRMADGELTIEQATEELERALVVLMGETL